VRIGFEICEDAWVAQRRGAELALTGVDLILNPSASHFAFGKQEVRRRLVLEGSRAFGVSYVYANLVGNEAGRAIYDGDALIATAGKVLAQGTALQLPRPRADQRGRGYRFDARAARRAQRFAAACRQRARRMRYG